MDDVDPAAKILLEVKKTFLEEITEPSESLRRVVSAPASLYFQSSLRAVSSSASSSSIETAECNWSNTPTSSISHYAITSSVQNNHDCSEFFSDESPLHSYLQRFGDLADFLSYTRPFDDEVFSEWFSLQQKMSSFIHSWNVLCEYAKHFCLRIMVPPKKYIVSCGFLTLEMALGAETDSLKRLHKADERYCSISELPSLLHTWNSNFAGRFIIISRCVTAFWVVGVAYIRQVTARQAYSLVSNHNVQCLHLLRNRDHSRYSFLAPVAMLSCQVYAAASWDRPLDESQSDGTRFRTMCFENCRKPFIPDSRRRFITQTLTQFLNPQ